MTRYPLVIVVLSLVFGGRRKGSTVGVFFLNHSGGLIFNFLTLGDFCVLLAQWNGVSAGVAQLVEYKLPKLGVASSNLVARSSVRGDFLFSPLMRYHNPAGKVAMKVGFARFFLCLFQGICEK